MLALGCLCLWREGAAQTPPLEYRQRDLLFNTELPLGLNWQSGAGVPLSATNHVPPGSDGRAPTVSQQISLGLTTAPASPGQFRAFVGVSAIPVQGTTNFSTNLNFAANAKNLHWPHGTDVNGNLTLVLRSAQVGAPQLGQQISFLFGSVIPVPSTDEYGVTLTNIAKENYWLPQPFTTNGYTNAPYYWSPNARAVFAIQAGGIDITWMKALPSLALPPDATNYVNQSGVWYRLYPVHYLVSGSPAKPPQKIYWTEGSFFNLGKAVDVPQGSVSQVNVVYNQSFPRRVAQAYQDPANVPVADTNTLTETRTLWFDSTGVQSQIHAYNAEGRVFVELLGELHADGVTRVFLGYEIVDVFKQATAQDVTVALGERLTAYPDGRDDSFLNPSPPTQTSSQPFYYQQQSAVSSGRTILYATCETKNLNDLQMHWLIAGVGGLRWPYVFARYEEVWPADVRRYSHYLRPLVPTEAQAQATAVALPSQYAPFIQYQDPLDQPRAKLINSSSFYTFLTPAYPVHRTLLRFTLSDQVCFERVFSWLDSAIKTNSLLAGTLATNLAAWNTNSGLMDFSSAVFAAPRLVNQTVNVGTRIVPPGDEIWSGTNYWAGYLLQTNGTSFNPSAYADPFAVGFTQANQGSIIPVNAIPGHNALEVWWFRVNNAFDGSRGLVQVYWPEVIGHYALQWPAAAPEIILASNAGSGPLDSLRAKGAIYYQNDPSLPGYNPNEEHAVMLGGQAYALRDDLNITNTVGYSSDPFVLIAYTDADGRPSMATFKVRREKPEAGILFDYVREAGLLLQAPMPLPLLEKPLEGPSGSVTNYNTEPPAISGDLPVGWDPGASPGSPYGHYRGFTYRDRNNDFWIYRGVHAGLPPLQAGDYNVTNNSFGPLPPAQAVLGSAFAYYLHTSRRTESLTVAANFLPGGLSFSNGLSGLAIVGTPTTAGSNYLTLTIQDSGDNSTVTNYLSLSVVSNGLVATQGPLVITSTNQYSAALVTYTNRPPHLAQAPTPTNSFTMRYYYKTLPGFAWPGLASPPPAGSVVPYLRPMTNGVYAGDPASKFTPSLSIVFRPVWPSLISGPSGAIPLPTLSAGETLANASHGLAAVRGQSSVQVLYQQSIALNLSNAPASVVLHDPTVAKKSYLGPLPASVQTSSYQGRIYFPVLPPHLVNRLYYDPGSSNLVFQGQFVNDTVGDSYLLLNVLRGADLTAVDALCYLGDPAGSTWLAAVANLSTPVYTFFQDPTRPGSYVVNTNLTVTRYVADLVEITNSDTQVDSYALSATGPGFGYVTYITANGSNPAHATDPVTVYIARVAPPLYPGEIKTLAAPNPLSELTTFQHSVDLAGRTDNYIYDWRIMPPVDGQAPAPDALGVFPLTYTNWVVLTNGLGASHVTLGGAGIQALSDNYVTMRYRSTDPLADPAITNWSAWTTPALAEGWIKRVLAGINPFDQRTTDLFNNPANTTASIISQAGPRWEGDVALNPDTLNNFGLIEIYETVMNRGKSLSINSGINYGPANDALLLAAGYLNDLYLTLGNEAWANSANPTIGFGTADKTYGNIATALFAFKGETASLLEQELDLLRGRNDFLSPGVALKPVYNRLYWNYTLGIDAGEVIYALNYNITDQNHDGVVNAADAAIMYPQGHGDAYGHFLTALMNYYSLLMNPNFDWVPRSEAVTVLGATVAVDYEDERKFASAAAALARAGRQVFDLTWRQNYQPGTSGGWGYMSTSQPNLGRSYGGTNYVTEYWGLDHWAGRTMAGAYLNWVVDNAILPPVDPDPTHQGIQKIDRTTVPELQELPTIAAQLQADLDNAAGGLTPLGLPQNSVPFDIDPSLVTGPNATTHFEQVYARAVATLNNAVVAFNDAQGVTQLMRSEEDSLSGFQDSVTSQELAYNNQLIALYGSPYPDDMGPGQTWPQDYTGPDLLHYMYVENPESTFNGAAPNSATNLTFQIDIQQLPPDWLSNLYQNFNFITPASSPTYSVGATNAITFAIGPNGFFGKPANWTSQRASPGSVQQAISTLIAAQNALRQELSDAQAAKNTLDKAINVFVAQAVTLTSNEELQSQILGYQQDIIAKQTQFNIEDRWISQAVTACSDFAVGLGINAPSIVVVGTAVGNDLSKLSTLIGFITQEAIKQGLLATDNGLFQSTYSDILGIQDNVVGLQSQVLVNQLNLTLQSQVTALGAQLNTVQGHLSTINQRLRGLDDAKRAYQALLAQGDRLQQERLTFRQHAAALVQGYRVRDAAFRIFQNEKLERYNTLFDLAAEYAFLAAQAYDYETGLLNTPAGKAFLNRIVSARALGVIANGQPQYAGSDTGDPGLSSALAEMKADWDVLRGRLGFNNPDGYSTTVSLRNENYRLPSTTDGDTNWKDVLQAGRMTDLLADQDVQRYCLQIDDGSGLPVPGIVISFPTVVANGLNLFGKTLQPGDHNYSASSFATKIFAVGVDFDGYIGMDNPPGTTGGTNSTSDPNALAATPYVYLIPVGVDSMRSPPLGDASTIRTWNVADVAIPLPFNISASVFASNPLWQSSSSLSEPLFVDRKHQAFRPVSTTGAFNTSIYGNNALSRTEYINSRLIGRSVWNSNWKLVIPGRTLLNDPNAGLDRFINSVRDVKLYFITYSYSGN